MIEGMLDRMAQLIEQLGHPSLERITLQHGRGYEPAALPAEVEMGLPRQCFENALVLAQRDEFTYVEGYALRPPIPLLIHHGWVTDGEGHAIDPTWDDNDDCLYWGIEFDWRWVVSLGLTGMALEEFARDTLDAERGLK